MGKGVEGHKVALGGCKVSLRCKAKKGKRIKKDDSFIQKVEPDQQK